MLHPYKDLSNIFYTDYSTGYNSYTDYSTAYNSYTGYILLRFNFRYMR